MGLPYYRANMLTQRLSGVRARLDSAPAQLTFLFVLLPLLAVYLVSNEREHQNVDAIASALPAWRIANHGDITLDDYAGLPWMVDTGERVVSNRPPGTAFWAVPFYRVAGGELPTRLPSMVPAAIAASAAAALAMAVLHLAFRRLTRPSVAVAAALIGGLATSTWTISSDQLWPHGPMQLWLALSVLAAAAGIYAGSGLALGAAIFTRPVAGFLAVAMGTSLGALRRSWRPVVVIGAGSLVGLVALMIYNNLAFGTPSPITDDYGSAFVDSGVQRGVFGYLANTAGMILNPRNSIFVWSPFLLFLVPGLRRAWLVAEPWVRASAVAGVAYMLVHLWLNRQSGGLSHNYRYPLAMLTMAAPLLLLSYRHWLAQAAPRLRRIFTAALVVSVVIQASEAWVTRQSLFLAG